jgi:hypothetical protein
MSTDFYEYLHGGQQQPRASRDLPITPQRQQQQAQQMFNSAMSNIEQVKRQLCEKIDVCCAQYGLYGLKVIDKAIAESLRAMINGVAQPMPQQPMPQQMPIQYPQVNENIYGGYAPRPQMMPPQQPMTREEALTDSFMNNLDTILSECDKDADKRAEEQMKQRLYEQKQADMMIAQNVDTARQNANIDLAAHENDFMLESEEDLREYV